MSRAPGPGTVVVVGGGIAGMSAAWELSRSAPPGTEIVLVEASRRLGGKIDTGQLGGAPVEWGPDAFLARVPWGAELCGQLGLGEELTSPAEAGAYLWSRNRLRRLPGGLALGVPTDLRALARSGTVSPPGVARAALDLVLPGPPRREDRSVGDVVTARFGPEVQARLVDPLVGGINAGRSELLSIAAVAPQLDSASRPGGSLIRALRAQAAAVRPSPPGEADRTPAPATAPKPVFLSHPRGLGHVVDTLATRLGEAGVRIRTGWAVEALTPAPEPGPGEAGRRRWTLRSGHEQLEADAVIVAVPAPAAAGLLAGACPPASAILGSLEHSSVVVTTFAFRATALARALDGSGFLVPRPEGRLMTAATWMSAKWAHVAAAAPGQVVIRVSAGRHRDERALQMDDGELASALRAELAEAMGLQEPPTETHVTRWLQAFPQYAVGHLDRVASLEAAVAAVPGLAVAGAAYRGVGIPACINSGRQAAARVLSE